MTIPTIAQRLLDLAAAIQNDQHEEPSNDPEAMRKKYGATLIRVNWMYAATARKHPGLKQVCTWSNGDEGFISV